MQKLLSTAILLLIFQYSVSSQNQEDAYTVETTPPKAERIPDNYQPQGSKANPLYKKLLQKAERSIGKGYKYGATGPDSFDCSGFTSYVFREVGINLPRSSSAQAVKGTKIKLSEVQPGDLVFFKTSLKGKTSHVALVTENKEEGIVVIHSTTSSGVIKEAIERSSYWKPRLLYARRFLK